jgi:hypothetical protein
MTYNKPEVLKLDNHVKNGTFPDLDIQRPPVTAAAYEADE